MRYQDIKENSSCGATSSGAIATAISGGTPPAGQFFGGDLKSSIYPVKRKKKKKAIESVHAVDEDKAPTAKPPKKPSGKAKIMSSNKPYMEPNVLGPTSPVKSTGKILGGTPKKNPTLSTKFFGTCSASNDPGNKSILGEDWNDEQRIVDEIDNLYQVADNPTTPRDKAEKLLKKIQTLYAEAKQKGYLEKWKKQAEDQAGNKHLSVDFLNMYDDIVGHVSHAKKASSADKNWLKKGNVLYDDPTDNWTDEDWAKALKIDGNLQPDNLKSDRPKQSDSEFLKQMGIKESLTYKEFKNARNAIDKVCPVCNLEFKNVHSPNQLFCSFACESKGGTAHSLKEAFRNYNNSKAYKEGFRNGCLDFQMGHRSELAWSAGSGASNDFRVEYGRGYRDGWLDARLEAAEFTRRDNSLASYYANRPDSVLRDQPINF